MLLYDKQLLLDIRTFVLYNDFAFITPPLMSNNLVINPHPPALNYSGQFPIRSLRKGIRYSSLLGTNISSFPKSASLTPYYPIPVPNSHIRSSKNLAIFYSKLIEPAGGFELDSNRANTAVNQHYLSPLQITASDP